MADVNQLFQRANQLYQKGRLKDAKKIYQKIIKQTPKFVDAVNMYGITLAQLGELPAAADQFSRIIKLEPKKNTAYENLARVYMQMNQFSSAQKIYQQLIQLDPRSYVAHFGLGGACMSQNLFDAALESFKKAQAVNSSQPQLFINLGTVLSQLGRVEEAIAAFQQALSLDASSAHALLRLGQLYINNNMFLQAEEVLTRADSIQPGDFDIQLSLADAYQHNAKDELAIKLYNAADKLAPGSQNIYTKLDKLILHSGSSEKKAVLDRLNEPYVYDGWDQPVQDAKQLADLTGYYHDDAISALHDFLDHYDPGELHDREWWQQQLNSFGDAKSGHDKILRGIHSAVFSWSLPDRQTLSSISEFVEGTSLYSYGAGSALWERLLSDHFGIAVKATDFSPRHSYLPISAEDYSKSTPPDNDTIFIAWIIRGDTGILNILNQMKPGQKLVLVGEPPDAQGVPRICATPEMFALLEDKFTLHESIPLVSYSLLNDTVSLYIKD